jgi:serine phosphatase RsbU (regulator of sigma subunit)
MGGDIYYFGVCKGDTITRLAIADVTGHGEAVSEISQYVYDSLKAHM